MKTLMIIFWNLIAIACVLEVGLRILGIGYGNSPLNADPDLHHVHPKDYCFLSHTPSKEFGGFQVCYDQEGYRVGEAPGELPNSGQRRIAFLGDSFTEALQVEWKDSFVGLFEANAEVSAVRNFGVSSYSPILNLVQAKQVREFSPTDVVVQIYENDFADNSNYLKLAEPLSDLSLLERVNAGTPNALVNFLRKSYLARLIRKLQLQLKFEEENKRVSSEAIENRYIKSISDEQWRVMKASLVELLRRLGDDMTVYFTFVPSKQLSMKNSCCVTDSVSQEFKTVISEIGGNYIDLAQRFERVEQQNELYFAQDIHWTEAGHAVVYEAIAEAIWGKVQAKEKD